MSKWAKACAFVFCAVVLCVSPVWALDDIEVNSRITQVTVYPDAAVITREAAVRLSPGSYRLVFPDIIPEVDENSLKVAVATQEGIKIQGVQLQREYLREDPSERIKSLKDQIQKHEDKVRELNNLKSAYLEEKGFINSIKLFSGEQIPKDLVTKVPAVGDLDQLLKFIDSKLKENFSSVMECELAIREENKTIEQLKRELAQVSGPSEKVRRSVVVEAEAGQQVSAAVSVSYMVGNASWRALYDARSQFEKSEVLFDAYGIVQQSTGEDWSDVEISLSTARPSAGGRLPYVAPWFLRPYQPALLDRQDVGATSFQSKAMAPMYNEMAFGGAEAKREELSKEKEVEVLDKGIAVSYKIPRKATVKSDGTDHKLAISSQSLKADFKYSTYPRLLPSAFLGSRVTNAPNLQLLAGRVNVFLEGDFVGTSGIEAIGPGEEFDLYLGVDDNVKVKREQLEKKVDETIIGGLPSPTRKTLLKYKLSVENYKTKPVNVKLFEAMPIPQDDRIKVKMHQVSLEPAKKDWEDRKGVWLWELQLAPKEKKEIVYSFTVEHPRDMSVEGL